MALKGTALIELKNVKTGEVERYHEDNMVTNALAELLRPIGYLKGSGIQNGVDYLYENFLGGLILFDKQIPELADQLFPPGSVSAVGYGARGFVNTTTDVALGSYNLTESELNEYSRYVKYVFDFATSQANGTINCVSLTHYNAGRYAGYGSATHQQSNQADINLSIQTGSGSSNGGINAGNTKADGFSFGSYEHIFLVEPESDIVYYFGIADKNTIVITKRKGNFLSIPVITKKADGRIIMETRQIGLGTEIPTTYVSWNYDHDDDCLYICSSSGSTVSSTGSFMVAKIRVSDWNVTQYTISNPTGSTLDTGNTRFAYVHQGYIYIKRSSTVYKINLEDPDDWATLSGSVNTNAVAQLAINGRVYYEYTYSSSGYSYLYIANGDTKKVERPTANALSVHSNQYTYGYTAFRGDPFHWLCEDQGVRTLYNYLATINNLARPIEKTSDKTMKITYTIQEV